MVGSPPTHWMFRAPCSAACGDHLGQELAGEKLSPLRIERIGLADAEDAAEVAARQVEQLRRDEFDFLAALHPIAVDASLGGRLAEAPLAVGAIDAATVLAQQAMSILLPRQFQALGPNRPI